MKATLSTTAEAILVRYTDFRDGLLQAIAPLPGYCFIEGKVGRIAQNDEIVLMTQGRDPITLTSAELKIASVGRVIAEWSKPPEE